MQTDLDAKKQLFNNTGPDVTPVLLVFSRFRVIADNVSV